MNICLYCNKKYNELRHHQFCKEYCKIYIKAENTLFTIFKALNIKYASEAAPNNLELPWSGSSMDTYYPLHQLIHELSHWICCPENRKKYEDFGFSSLSKEQQKLEEDQVKNLENQILFYLGFK